jgi:hypothetical protein
MFLFVELLSEKLCRENPDNIYVFGDNLIHIGKGGQAIIRDEPNAFGVPTKRLPSMSGDSFFSDLYEEYIEVRRKLIDLWNLHLQGFTIVLPTEKIGSGLARLWETSPTIGSMIDKFYEAAKRS